MSLVNDRTPISPDRRSMPGSNVQWPWPEPTSRAQRT